MLFCIVLVHAGILPALLVFLLWRFVIRLPVVLPFTNPNAKAYPVPLECLLWPRESARSMKFSPPSPTRSSKG